MAGLDAMGNKGRAAAKKGAGDKFAHFGRKRQGYDFDWRVLGSNLFAAAMGCCANYGAAVMVGGAAGGRGCVISIYLGGDKNRTYVNDAEEFTDWCYDAIEAFGSSSEDTYGLYGIERREGDDSEQPTGDDQRKD